MMWTRVDSSGHLRTYLQQLQHELQRVGGSGVNVIRACLTRI
jgi:hypothetical protein